MLILLTLSSSGTEPCLPNQVIFGSPAVLFNLELVVVGSVDLRSKVFIVIDFNELE